MPGIDVDAGLSSRSTVTLALEPSYRASILELSRSIRHLDLRRVSEDERRAAQAQAKRESERLDEMQRKERAEADRLSAIRAIEQAWEQRNSAREHNDSSSTVGAAAAPSAGGAGSGEDDCAPSGDEQGVAMIAPSIGAQVTTPSPPALPQPPNQSPRGASARAPSASSGGSYAASPSSSFPYSSCADGSRGGAPAGSEFKGHVEVTDVAAGGGGCGSPCTATRRRPSIGRHDRRMLWASALRATRLSTSRAARCPSYASCEGCARCTLSGPSCNRSSSSSRSECSGALHDSHLAGWQSDHEPSVLPLARDLADPQSALP